MSDKKPTPVISRELWTRERAIAVGNWLVSYGQTHKLAMAIAVFLDDQRVFQYALEGTSAENDLWIERKRRTVELTKLSSLGYRKVILSSGISDSDLPLTDGVLAFCGGGYPLLDSSGYRGVAVVSGLPHLVDDEIVSKAVEELANQSGASQ